MPPVVNGLARPIMGTIDDTAVLTDDLAFCGDYDTIRIDPKAHRTIGEGCRDAVAIALKMHEAGGRDTLRIFRRTAVTPDTHPFAAGVRWLVMRVCAGEAMGGTRSVSVVRSVSPIAVR